MKLKINRAFAGYKAGTITVPDKNGVPLDQYWRRRLRDAKIDNCVEVVTDPKPKPKKAKAKSEPVTEKAND